MDKWKMSCFYSKIVELQNKYELNSEIDISNMYLLYI